MKLKNFLVIIITFEEAKKLIAFNKYIQNIKIRKN
jgi:hypothetical protein